MDDTVVYSKRTFVSLVMVVFALTLGIGAYALVNLDLYDKLPANFVMAAALWGGLGMAAWTVVRWRLPYADPLLLPSVLLLNGLGIAMIYRLDQASSPPMQSGRLQLEWTVAAMAVLIVTVFLLRDYRPLQRYTYLWFAIGLFLLLLPLVPGLGKESHGARVWIQVGQFSFQPGELAKIVLSVAFASYLTEKRDVLASAGRRILGIDFPRARDLGPIAVMWATSLLILVFETDLGMSLLFFSLFVAMVYVATQRPSWAILGIGMVGLMGVLGYLNVSHVRVRFQAWLNPFGNFDQNYQIISAQYGMAYGGLFGTGWGLGRPYLTPIAKSDFIIAAIGEELGLVGLFAVLLVYLVIVVRVLRTALAGLEPFGKLLASGLAFVFALQVLIIVGGVTRLLPLTGLTTPFMSQGGSSLISNYLLLALLLVLTHQTRRPQPLVPTDDYAVLTDEATTAIPAVAAPWSAAATVPPAATQDAWSSADQDPTQAIPPTRPEHLTEDTLEPTQAIRPVSPTGAGHDGPTEFVPQQQPAAPQRGANVWAPTDGEDRP